MKTQTIDPALQQSVKAWISIVQQTLGRQGDSPSDDFLAEHAASAVQGAHNDVPNVCYQGNLPGWANCLFHSSIMKYLYEHGGGTFFDSHRSHWYFLPEEEQVRYTALTAASSIPVSKTSSPECYPGVTFQEVAVNVLKRVWGSRPLGNDKDLQWEKTINAASTAAHTLAAGGQINNIEDLSQENFIALCQRTHEIMVARGLWGKDNTNPDRAYQNGAPKSFNELSQNMKGNYLLIVLSYLVAKSYYDNKADKPVITAA